MKKFWFNRTILEKVFIVIIAILTVFSVYKGISFSVLKYQYIQSELQQLQVYKDSLSTTQEQLQLKITELTEVNTNAKKKAISTNKKLKDATKKIDNSTISASERNNVISKYEALVNNK